MNGNGGGRDDHSRKSAGTAAAILAWEDLTVEVAAANFGKKVVVHGLSGYAEPGRLMAVMGSSGSGKSTLLDSLAGFFPTLLFFLFHLPTPSKRIIIKHND